MTGSMSGWGGCGSSPWGTMTAYLAHQKSPPHSRLAPCPRFLPAKRHTARCLPGTQFCTIGHHMLPCASPSSASRALLASAAGGSWQRCCNQYSHASNALVAFGPAQAASAASPRLPLRPSSRYASWGKRAHLFRNDESADEESTLLLVQNACQDATRLHALGGVAAGVAAEGRG